MATKNKNRVVELRKQVSEIKDAILEKVDALESVEYELDNLASIINELKELS